MFYFKAQAFLRYTDDRLSIPDYVYNPKEARLRKAMREQSRELSRQSILQTAIASATGNASGVGNGSQPVTGSSNFLNHPLNCPPSAAAAASVAAAAVSSLPGSPSFNSGNRIINPWFPAGHPPSANHLKPILSPRVSSFRSVRSFGYFVIVIITIVITLIILIFLFIVIIINNCRFCYLRLSAAVGS